MSEPVFVENWEVALAVGLRIGSVSAPVHVIEFGDFECPYCAKFESIVTELRTKYPESVAITFAHYPLVQHSAARQAAVAAECANEQHSFNEMKALLFDNNQNLDSVDWGDLALEAKVEDVEAFNDCLNDTNVLDRVDRSRKFADSIGVSGTPEIIINGWMLPHPPTFQDFEQMIENVNGGLSPVAGLFE